MSNESFVLVPQSAIDRIINKLDSLESVVNSIKNNPLQETEANDLINLQQAAAMLNLAVPTIYGLVHNSKIPHFKQGKKLRFSKKDLVSWIKSGRNLTVKESEVIAANYVATKKNRTI